VVFGGEAGMEHQVPVFRQAFAPVDLFEIADEVLVHRTHGIDGLALNQHASAWQLLHGHLAWGVRVDSKYLKRGRLLFHASAWSGE